MANGTVSISRFGPKTAMATIFLDTTASSVSLVATGNTIEVLGIHCYFEGTATNHARLVFTDFRGTATDILFDGRVGDAALYSPKIEKVFKAPNKSDGLQVDITASSAAVADTRVNVEFRYL